MRRRRSLLQYTGVRGVESVSKTWRLIDTGICKASFNMAVDEALLNNFKDSDLPILRLYGWKPSLSLGRFSNLHATLNQKTLKMQNIPFIRRMSGGGVLVHGGDLSYSLILPKSLLNGIGVKESYRHLCSFLIKLYEKLELQANFASQMQLKISKSNVCMAANEAYDVVIDGKKMGANAQRHSRNILFQHGSIPISLDESFFKDVFLEESGLKSMLTLDKIKKDITYQRVRETLIKSFKESFEVDLMEDFLTPKETQNTQELLESKYAQKRWNEDGKLDKT